MAIAVDNTSSSANQTGSSVSFSHTCAGSNRVLLVGVTIADSTKTVSGITYNSVALVKVDAIDMPSASRRAELWYLVAPATGSNTIAVTLTGAPISFFNVGAVSYTGVRQDSTPAVSGKYSDNAANDVLKSITTLSDNSWLVGAMTDGASANPAADSGTTLRLSVYNRAGNGYEMFFLDTNGPKTPAGAFAIGVTGTSGVGGAIVVAQIAPIINLTITDTSSSSDTVVRSLTRTLSDSVSSTDSVSKKQMNNQRKSTAGTWTPQSKS